MLQEVNHGLLYSHGLISCFSERIIKRATFQNISLSNIMNGHSYCNYGTDFGAITAKPNMIGKMPAKNKLDREGIWLHILSLSNYIYRD